MGADQSTSSQATLKSQRDEDIPYTSCSISKPISSDASRASPRATGSHQSKLTKSREAHHNIVVVADGTPTVPAVDVETQRLSAVPPFLPLLRGTVAHPVVSDESFERLSQLDGRHVLALCTRYQEHLYQCAEAIAFDQNALCVRIKEVDFALQSLYGVLSDQQKRFAQHAEQIKKVGEISTALNRIHTTLEQTVPLMERLNSILPPEEQLETFSFTESTN